jgi:Amt family ammonium transporter
MGLMAGAVCYGGVMLKHKIGYDDSLDAFGVHGIGGAFGAVATGIFATVGVGSLMTGDVHQFWVQIIGVLAAGAYAVTVTVILLWILKKTIGLRVSRDEEIIGLDQTLHSESGYDL